MITRLDNNSCNVLSRELTVLGKKPKDSQTRNQQLSQIVLSSAVSHSRSRRPLPVQRVSSTNGQIVEFSYSPKNKQVTARILNPTAPSVVISMENLPREIHCIRSLDAFFALLSNAYVNVSILSDGAQRIYLNQRLLGGVSYEETLASLKEHLFSILNPCVVRDVLAGLKQISEGVIDTSEGILGVFEKMPLPRETMGLLRQLNDQIIVFSKELNPSQLSEQLSKIKANFGQLPQMVEKYRADDDAFVTWTDLDVLLALPQIRRLDNNSLIKIKRQIDKKDVEGLRDLVKELLQDNQLNVADVDAALASEYGNLDTLLGEIIDQRPQKKEGLNNYWNQESSFFQAKTLSLTDPKTSQSYTGVVVKCRRKGQNWIFQLESNCEIEITPQYFVTLREQSRYGFWKGFSKMVNGDQVFEVTCTQPSEKSLLSGLYRRGASKNKKATLKSTALNAVSFGFAGNKESSQEIELLDGATNDKKYLIKAYYQEESASDPFYRIEILQWDPLKGDYLQKEEEIISDTPWGIDAKYKLINVETKSITGIDLSNIEKLIQIKDVKDDSKVKLQQLKEIQEEIGKIRDEFVREETRALLDELIGDFIKQKFHSVSIELLKSKSPQLAARVQEVAERYARELQADCKPEDVYKPEDILKKIIVEANYASLVAKQKNNVVARTMELLKDAYDHIKGMENKDTILFMGNTGAGKSSAVTYLLGVPLETFTNRVGDKVIRVKENSSGKPYPKYPKIGQSLGESETLYTQGYELEEVAKGKDTIIIGDCPGFADTRGQEYELCTNFSIDNAVRNVAKIKAIVLTIPITAFLVDRGNGVIDLVETVRERFPWTFDIDQSQHSSKVYVLITKSQQAQAETVAALKDGTRITELFKEGQKRIEKLLQKSQETGGEIDSFELEGVKRRNGIWQSLQLIQSQGRFDFVDIGNLRGRVRLLEKYRGEGQIDKRQYAAAMQGRDMQMKFGKYVQMSADTWALHIFKQYAQDLPLAVGNLEDEIRERRETISQLEIAKINRQKQIQAILEEQANLDKVIQQLKSAKANPAQLTEALKRELQEQVTQANSSSLRRQKEELKQHEDRIKQAAEEVAKISRQIQVLREKQGRYGEEIERISREITRLSSGSTTEKLYEQSWWEDSMLHLQTWKDSNTRKGRLENVEHAKDEDFKEGIQEVRAKDYRGKLSHLAIIEKDYKIAPVDKEQRRIFETYKTDGKYTAKLEGHKFEIDLGMKAAPTGKKIAYGFLTTWDGSGLPWIRISHEVPNIDYYEATIINLDGQKTLQIKQKEEIRLELEGGGLIKGKNKEKIEAEQTLEQLRREKIEREAQIRGIEEGLKNEQLDEMLHRKEADRERLMKEKANLEDTSIIDGTLRDIGLRIEVDRKKLQALQIRKRNLALVIKLQGQTAKLLREFAGHVILDSEPIRKGGSREQDPIINACREFIAIYDGNIERIEKYCDEDLTA